MCNNLYDCCYCYKIWNFWWNSFNSSHALNAVEQLRTALFVVVIKLLHFVRCWQMLLITLACFVVNVCCILDLFNYFLCCSLVFFKGAIASRDVFRAIIADVQGGRGIEMSSMLPHPQSLSELLPTFHCNKLCYLTYFMLHELWRLLCT